jgi:hypothetical protein
MLLRRLLGLFRALAERSEDGSFGQPLLFYRLVKSECDGGVKKAMSVRLTGVRALASSD